MTLLAWLAERTVRAYQIAIRPLLPRACRFAPTCSEYARLVLVEHGFVRGLWLAVKRIGRCHPFHPGGFDPPPPRRVSTERQGR
jgi:putative membrane protein insertion efficiency factor